MNSTTFNAHIEYLLKQGYTQDELNEMTLGEIIALVDKNILLEKGKEK